MQSAQFELHAELEEKHWWFRGRRHIIRRLVDQVLPAGKNTAVIDIGCGTGASGSVVAWASTRLAINTPGTVYSCPLSTEKCSCHRSSRPGEVCRVVIDPGVPPLRVPLFSSATRGAMA